MGKRASRKLAVILHADIVGSTSLVQRDETLAHNRIHDAFQRFSKVINSYGGATHEIRGDALVAEFERASDAAPAAVAFQAANTKLNATLTDDIKPRLRIGISLGEVVIADDTVTGAGVVLAQRLEQLSEPDGVCIQGAAYETMPKWLPFEYESMGDQEVKGFDDPVRAFTVSLRPGGSLPDPDSRVTSRRSRSPLHWTIGVSVVSVVVVVLVLTWRQPWRSEIEPASVERLQFELPDKPSIAVLPFENISDDPEQEYFADGLSEDIISILSQIPNLFVIARNSTFTYKGNPVKVQQVAEELGVRYVLEGSVRRAGNQVRVTAQLIDAITGNHVWAERYDRETGDIFALQDEITLNIASALQVELTEGDQARIRSGVGTTNLEAWSQVVRAIGLFRRFTKEDMVKAREMLEEAIELDPQYALAWSLIGWTHWHDARWGWSESRKASLSKATEVARKALTFDDALSDNYQLLGSISLMKHEYDEAIAFHEKAVALDPNGADGVAILGFTLTYAGRPQEAALLLRKAMRLSPYYPTWYLSTLGRAYRLSGQYEKAIEVLKRSVERNPDFLHPHVVLAVIYSELNRSEEARIQTERILEIDPRFSIAGFSKALPYRDSAELERIQFALRKLDLPQ